MIHMIHSKSLLTKFAKRYTRSRQLIPVMSRVLHTAKDDPYAAIKSGDTEKVAFLLNQHVKSFIHPTLSQVAIGDIYPEKKLNDLLRHAVSVKANAEIVDHLLSAGADPASPDDLGANAVHFAAHHGQSELLSMLIGDEGRTLRGSEKEIPFPNAGREGIVRGTSHSTERLKLVDSRRLSNDGATALWEASYNGDTRSCEVLLAFGANPNLPRLDMEAKHPACTPLGTAVSLGHADICSLLIRHGAHAGPDSLLWTDDDGIRNLLLEMPELDINSIVPWLGPNGSCILVHAIALGDMTLVKALLSNNANAEVVTPGGFTAFHVASQFGSVESLRLLLEFCKDEFEQMIRLRTNENPANPKAGNRSPLRFAVENGHPEVVRFLLENAGDELSTKDYSNETHITQYMHITHPNGDFNIGWPETVVTNLHICAASRSPANLEIARLLIQHGADIEVQMRIPKDQQTSLHQASGLMPFHIACLYNYVEMAELLLENGANPSVPVWLERLDGKIMSVYASTLAYANNSKDVQQLLQKLDITCQGSYVIADPAAWQHPETGAMLKMKTPVPNFRSITGTS